MLKPTQSNLIIKPMESEEKTSGGLLIPDNTQEKPQKGEIVAVNPKDQRDTDFNAGDIVYYKKWGGDTIKYEDVEYIVINIKDVLAVI